MNAHQDWHEISAAASHKLTEYRQSTASKDRISFMENHAYWCAQVAVERSRGDAPCTRGGDDAAHLLGKMDVVQAYADAAYIASVHAHHALWAGLLEYGWDEKTEAFGKALADRISKEIAAKAKKIGIGEVSRSAATTVEPVAWRWRTLPQWIKHGSEAGWNYTDTEPTASDFMNAHHHEIEPLYAAPTTSPSDGEAKPSTAMTERPIVDLMPMQLSDGRTDYFVRIKVGDREVTPHVFRDEYKSAYHVALYDWLLNGTSEEPELMDFGPREWPAVRLATPTREAVAQAIYEVSVRWIEPGLGMKMVPFKDLGERDMRLHLEYADAVLSIPRNDRGSEAQ